MNDQISTAHKLTSVLSDDQLAEFLCNLQAKDIRTRMHEFPIYTLQEAFKENGVPYGWVSLSNHLNEEAAKRWLSSKTGW